MKIENFVPSTNFHSKKILELLTGTSFPIAQKKLLKKFQHSSVYLFLIGGNKLTFSNEMIKVRKTFPKKFWEISVRKENFRNKRFKGKSLSWCLVISSNVNNFELTFVNKFEGSVFQPVLPHPPRFETTEIKY